MRMLLSIALLVVAIWGRPLSHAQSAGDTLKTHSTANLSQRNAADTGPDETTLPEIPSFSLEFKDTLAVPGIPSAHVFESPISCSSDGMPFVSFPQPPDFMSRVIYSLDPKGPRAFSAQKAPGLYDPIFQSYFVGDSIVGILVRATKDGKKAPYSMTILPGMPPKDVYPGEHHDYVIEFDRDGNFRKILDLPTLYHFWRIAELGDQNFLALAFDEVNSGARLFLLDSDGQIVKPVELPSEMTESPELVQGQSGGMLNRARAESSMSWWLFATVGPKVLLYKARSKSPILEVGPGGVVRIVPLTIPKGYVLEGAIPSSSRWLLRFRKESVPVSGATDANSKVGNYALFEFDPEDGTIRRRIDIAKGPIFGIACDHEGIVTGFSMTADKILLNAGNLPR